MNRLFIALPVLLCIAGVASSQSLADIAKKEKERRKENARQGNKTVFEAESVGTFGHVWWRVEDKTTATGGAPSAKSGSETATGEAPSAKSGSETATGEAPETARAKTTKTKNGIRFNRGNLALRKSSRRRP